MKLGKNIISVYVDCKLPRHCIVILSSNIVKVQILIKRTLQENKNKKRSRDEEERRSNLKKGEREEII